MLNYGYQTRDEDDYRIDEWTEASAIDLVSALKTNNNHFFKKVKKALKQSAIFYEQRYSMLKFLHALLLNFYLLLDISYLSLCYI